MDGDKAEINNSSEEKKIQKFLQNQIFTASQSL
jgi:hypothetical protein